MVESFFGACTLPKEWCEELAKIPLRFQPGKDWGYGYSSDVLGRSELFPGPRATGMMFAPQAHRSAHEEAAG